MLADSLANHDDAADLDLGLDRLILLTMSHQLQETYK
jgi:hypothetical protein